MFSMTFTTAASRRTSSPTLLAGALAMCLAASVAQAADTDAVARPSMEVTCTLVLAPAPVAKSPGTIRVVEKLTVAPGADAHRHKHDMPEVLTVIEGQGALTIDGKPDVALKPGVVVEIPAEVRHQQHNASKTEPLVYTALFVGKEGSHVLTGYVGEKDRPVGCPHRLRAAR
jgi:quercetin dioxygenase-like cupin family protein